MKRALLLLCGTFCITAAQAQFATQGSAIFANPSKAGHFVNKTAPQTTHRTLAKTTAVTIATENFGTGTTTTLPAGWTAGSFSGGGSWHWSSTAPTSMYSGPMGAMHSTTAANGWMIYDSDSIGAACSCAPGGWLQSPAYNCTGHTTVRLNFQNFFRHWDDTCQVWVSTDPTFATGVTAYPVSANNALSNSVSSPNVNTLHVNITSAAAGMAAVYVRFVYKCTFVTGGYAWMVDDMTLTELNPHDASNSNSFLWEPGSTGGSYDGSIFNTPLTFVDSVFPITELSNFGSSVETGLVTTARIFQGSTVAYTQNNTYASLPVNAFDSLVQFPPFKPTAVASYKCVFNTALTADSDLSNNVDTVLFNVTDTTWQENLGAPNGSYYCYKSGSSPESYMNGARFDVPATSVGDTVSGFGVAFSSSSLPTTGSAKVSVQLYSIHEGGSGWNYVATSVARPISVADISTSTALVWADFRIDPVISGGIGTFILQPATTYAVMVQVNGVTTDLLVEATAAPDGTGIIGYMGQSDTSQDNGATSFSPASIATGNPSAVPMVRMYFGNITSDHTAIGTLTAGDMIGAAYPNPANTSVTIPFTLATSGSVTVTLTNIVGQVVKTQTLEAKAGQSMRATLPTGDLASGVYLYNVAANGQHTTGRVSVAH